MAPRPVRRIPATARRRLGELIRDRRAALGLSQQAVAKQLGTDAGSLSRIETGKREPSLYQITRLSEILGVQPSRLLSVA